MREVLISQSNYIPWKGYFDAINSASVFVLYDDMQFTKRDWRNRNKIKTAQGVQWLTIPVEVKGKFFQRIRDTKISDAGWAKQHWNTIQHAYAKAPYFKEMRPLVEPLYLESNETYLSEVNYRFLKAIADFLGIKTEFKWSSEFDLRGEKSERLLNICVDLNAERYASGPAAKDYLDEEIFRNSNIAVRWLDYSGYPEYPQLHGDFDHAVSILDLIFNTGPNSRDFLKTFA